MGAYSDFMRRYGGTTGNIAANVQSLFNQIYDKSHGSKRYQLSNTPWGILRKLEDKSQRAQDEYDKTGIDPVYSDHYDSALYGTATGAVGVGIRVPGMARSLADLYIPEVRENVGVTKRHRVRNM